MAISVQAADMSMPIRGVSDGDTIQSSVALPCPLCRVSVRIRGIDTPESTYLAKCPKEKALGMKSKIFLSEFLSQYDKMLAKDIKWDKYGGRIDAIVFVNGTDVGALLISKGYALPYDGIGSKPNWCN